MVLACHVKPILMLPVPFITIFTKGIERRKILKDDTDRINFLDQLGKVLSETKRNIYI